jgi:hypothetical protein
MQDCVGGELYQVCLHQKMQMWMNKIQQDYLDTYWMENIISPNPTTCPETSTRSAVQRPAGRCEAGSHAEKSTPVSVRRIVNPPTDSRSRKGAPDFGATVREPGPPVSAQPRPPPGLPHFEKCGRRSRGAEGVKAGGTTRRPLVLQTDRGVFFFKEVLYVGH